MRAETRFTLIVLALALLACNTITSAPTLSPVQITATPAITVIVITNPPVKPTPTPTPTLTPTPASTPDPAQSPACTRPPDDATRVQVNGETLSIRTRWMLQLAQHLYGGPGDLLRVVQGSYAPGLEESFGTHDGGGAVDISIRNPANPDQVMEDEAPKMALAMRKAGFAAWYRPAGILTPGSGAHIHAIAIGDPELSQAARRQLDGPEGYFRGLDGLPPQYGGPHPDSQGGPVVCPWMIEMGYKDLR